MAASLEHINPDTSMGANLVADGATFRVWAPRARAVYVLGEFNGRRKTDASLLTMDEHGHWRGFIGNGGRIFADAQPMHGFGFSAALVLPANSVLVFAR
jgi:1,4-alpha-glucan branching enzyme